MMETDTSPLVANSWGELVSAVRKANRELGFPDIVWYRGHSNSHWQLIPSLHRFRNGLQKEQLLFRKYQQAAARLIHKRETDWETLFDMQHYYIPTRLLDWSEVLGIAAFFAVLREYEEACVFVLDPGSLNRKSTGRHEVKRADEKTFNYQEIYWEKKPFTPQIPIAMEPPFQNERMLAQKGMFTIHGDDPRGLEIQCPECIQKIILTKEARQDILEFLEYANINEYSVFPDIVGLAPFVKSLVKLE